MPAIEQYLWGARFNVETDTAVLNYVLENIYRALTAPYTKELWVPAKNFDAGLGAPTFNNTGGWANFYAAWNFPAGANSGVGGYTYLPSDYAGGVIYADTYFQGAGTGNFRADGQGVATAPGTPGATLANTGAATGSVTTPAYNGLAFLNNHFIIAAGAPGSLVNMAVDRNGVNALDTSPNVMNFFGVRLRYLANR